MPERPHLGWPVRLAPGGRLVAVEQDSDEDLASCVAVIVSYPEGVKRGAPTFGRPEVEFSEPNLTELREAVERNEPRVRNVLTDELVTSALAQVRIGFSEAGP